MTKGLSFLTTIISSGYNDDKTSIAKLPFKSAVAFCTADKNLLSVLSIFFVK